MIRTQAVRSQSLVGPCLPCVPPSLPDLLHFLRPVVKYSWKIIVTQLSPSFYYSKLFNLVSPRDRLTESVAFALIGVDTESCSRLLLSGIFLIQLAIAFPLNQNDKRASYSVVNVDGSNGGSNPTCGFQTVTETVTQTLLQTVTMNAVTITVVQTPTVTPYDDGSCGILLTTRPSTLRQ